MQQGPPVQPQFNQPDEIDLLDLIEGIWHQKWLILLVTLIALALGGTFAFISTPTYTSKVFLLPPTEKDLAELRQPSIGPTSTATTPSQVYDAFLLNLDSNKVKRAFLERAEVKAYFAETTTTAQQQWKAFNKALSISLPSRQGSVSASAGFELNDPGIAAKWSNKYSELVSEATRDQLTTDLLSELQSELSNIELQIANRRAIFESQLDTEIQKLQEALQIAKAIGLTSPMKNDSIIDDTGRTMIDDTGRTMIDEVRKLYSRGSKALLAEIEAIKARRNNDIFTPGLLQLEQKKSLLESVKIDSHKIQPVNIDLEAQVADQPTKPRKILILALSAVLGSMLGVMIALIRIAVLNRKQAKAQA